uniref:Uncharacterized protein n=1 Tax=Timema shepardi TaxID=629360 RepID=A0A7R9G3G5_TIMSH|nr:unnamed protein product [Timema shepardi]
MRTIRNVEMKEHFDGADWSVEEEWWGRKGRDYVACLAGTCATLSPSVARSDVTPGNSTDNHPPRGSSTGRQLHTGTTRERRAASQKRYNVLVKAAEQISYHLPALTGNTIVHPAVPYNILALGCSGERTRILKFSESNFPLAVE